MTTSRRRPMRKRRRRGALLACALLLAALLAATPGPAPAEEPVLLLTEDAKPLNYADGDRIKGIAADIVSEALDEADIAYRMELLPWARAYARAREEPGTFIFSMSRSPERERQFAWVAALAPSRIGLFRLRSRRDLADACLADLPGLRVAAIKGYSTVALLHRLGVPAGNLTLFQDNARQTAIEHLEMGRSDVFLGDRLVFGQALVDAGKADRVTHQCMDVRVGDFWLAAHPATHPDVLRRVGEAVRNVQASGRGQAILRQYTQSLELP